MATVYLRPGRESRVTSGHLWIYSGEIARMDGEVRDGGPIDVRTFRGRWLGRGYINRKAALTARLLTHKPEEIDEAFFRRRLAEVWAYRQRVLPSAGACRVINGEGDMLPGLIADRYGDVFVVQTLTLGMEQRKEMLARLLQEIVPAAAVYERNDPAARTLEGLPRQAGWIAGERETRVEIGEGAARFLVDIAHGQKTGFFLDQRENRLAVATLLKESEVLDAFCYTGGFSIQAALAGAKSVVAVDSSAEALVLGRHNAELNGVTSRCTFVEANAFDELRRLSRDGAQFDAVILDPPAFARTKDALPRAAAGYKEINLRALKLLRPGGLLVSCSCSFHMPEALLQQVVASAAVDAKRELRLVDSRGHARDHPVHPAMPETRYLTCLVLEVH